MAIGETAPASGSQTGALERPVEGTTGLPHVIEAWDRDSDKRLHETDASDNGLSGVSTTDFVVEMPHKHTSNLSLVRHPGTTDSTELDGPRYCPSLRKKNAPSVVREESCFRMIELTEALAMVDREVRSAVHIQLRNLPPCHTSQMNTSIRQGGDSSQAVKPHVLPADLAGFAERRCLEQEATSLRDADTEENDNESRGRHCLVTDFVRTDNCLVETVAPPFLGRRVGAPEGVTAPFALPPFRASLVDGYALHIPSGRWGEVQELYRKTYSRQEVNLDAAQSGDNCVPLKIAGEVRAGASLTGDTVQPFRGHQHIWAGMRVGGTGGSRGRCYPSNQTNRRPGLVCEARAAAVPPALQCVYVTTGSPVPGWCNAVVPVESCEVDVDNGLCWPDHEVVSKIHGKGENIRGVGTDAPAKSLLMQQGQLIGPAEEGLLAAVGIEKLDVFRKLNVHTLALGDELRSRVAAATPESGESNSDALQSECERCLHRLVRGSPACDTTDHDAESPKTKQEPMCSTCEKRTTNSATAAVYDSNSPMLKALLSQHCPSTRLGQQHMLPDDVDKVQRLLLDLALKEQPRSGCLVGDTRSPPVDGSERGQQDRGVDVLVSTGGVSMGGSDCMKLALLQLQRNSFGVHQCGQVNAGDRERWTLQGKQNRSDRERLPGGPTADSGDRRSVSNGSEDTTQCREVDIGRKTGTASLSDTAPCVTQDWSYTVETEIKFGRLNVKPGKPAMFAVLRVFRRDAANTAKLESDDAQTQHQVLGEEFHDLTVTQQTKNKNDTVSSSAVNSPGMTRLCPDVTRGTLFSTSLTSGEVRQPFSSREGPRDRHRSRSPVRVLLVFALPGNPCSAWVLFHLLVAPALNSYSSFCPSTSLSAHVPAQTLAAVDEPVVADTVRPEYHRALVYVEHSYDKAGPWHCDGGPSAQRAQSSASGWCASDRAALQLHAFPTGRQASSRLLSCCASANGLILVAPSKASLRPCIAAGETVPVLLFGPPFPGRPDALIRLLKVQNKVIGYNETKCRCGDDKERPEGTSAIRGGKRQTTSTTDLTVRTREPEVEAPSCTVHSVGNLVDTSATALSHFSCGRPVGEAVRLGIVIVSDRCFRGTMQDACAETLLKVLRSSNVVATLLQPSSQREPSVSLLQGSVCAARTKEGEFPGERHTWDRIEKQSERIVIVPDLVERIQDAVFSMLCACADDPKMMVQTGAEESPPRRSVIFVCGGTGLSTRDVTPQALLPLFTVRCNGIEHLLLEHSLRCTPLAALGRPCAGVIECRAGREVEDGNGSSRFVFGGICQSATKNGACTQGDTVTCSLPEKSCSCTVPVATKAPRDFAGAVTNECCHRHALQNLISCKRMTTCQEVPYRSKAAVGGRGAIGSPPAPPDSGPSWAFGLVDADRREVSRRPSGCGARGMVVVFPGSPKAVRELAEALLPVLPHALEQLSK